MWGEEYKSWQTLASVWEEFTQPDCRQDAKLRTDGTVRNSHTEPTRCHRAGPCRVLCFLRRTSSHTYADQSSSVSEMAFKLTLEVGALKGSRKEEDFSLGSPHLERVFSFSDVRGDLSPLYDGTCETPESALWMPFLSSRRLAWPPPPTGGFLGLIP